MFNYCALDTCMREDACRREPDYVGKKVKAEVYTDGITIRNINGVCINVYANTGFFDSIVYLIKDDETGEIFSSPAYYHREWENEWVVHI